MLHHIRYWACAITLASVAVLGGTSVLAGTTSTASRAYVVFEVDTTGATPGEVAVIDTSTNSTIATIPVGLRPGAVVVAPDGSRAYVTNRVGPGGLNVDSSISVIDTALNTVVATVVIPTAFPQAIDITPDGSLLYVANSGSANVIAMDTTSHAIVATIPVGVEPFGLAITPDGTRALVSNFRSNNVSVIDTGTNAVVATIGTGGGPNQIGITPDGTRAYVANSFSNTVSVIGLSTSTVIATVSVGALPVGAAVTPDGAHAYIANATSTTSPGSVSVIDTATNTVVSTVPAGNFTFHVAITPDGSLAYVTNEHGASITVIDTATHTVCATLSGSPFPFGVDIATVTTNQPPTADAGPDQSIHAGDLVELDGSGSFDDNTAAEDLVYAWTLTAPLGSTAVLSDETAINPTFTADKTGAYTASLVVTDEGGLASAADEVVISSTNLAPTADAGVDLVTAVGLDIAISGSATDPEGDTLTFLWTVASSPAGSTVTLTGATTLTPTVSADTVGEYTLSLVAGDPFADSAPDTMTLTVISGDEFAEVQLLDASDALAAFDDADFDSNGHRTSATAQVGNIIKDLQKGKTDAAIHKLEKLIERTDGCALRGTPDASGPGRDWVVECAAQDELYPLLAAALEALQG